MDNLAEVLLLEFVEDDIAGFSSLSKLQAIKKPLKI